MEFFQHVQCIGFTLGILFNQSFYGIYSFILQILVCLDPFLIFCLRTLSLCLTSTISLLSRMADGWKSHLGIRYIILLQLTYKYVIVELQKLGVAGISFISSFIITYCSTAFKLLIVIHHVLAIDIFKVIAVIYRFYSHLVDQHDDLVQLKLYNLDIIGIFLTP